LKPLRTGSSSSPDKLNGWSATTLRTAQPEPKEDRRYEAPAIRGGFVCACPWQAGRTSRYQADGGLCHAPTVPSRAPIRSSKLTLIMAPQRTRPVAAALVPHRSADSLVAQPPQVLHNPRLGGRLCNKAGPRPPDARGGRPPASSACGPSRGSARAGDGVPVRLPRGRPLSPAQARPPRVGATHPIPAPAR
jgi:hypothetical protein